MGRSLGHLPHRSHPQAATPVRGDCPGGRGAGKSGCGCSSHPRGGGGEKAGALWATPGRGGGTEPGFTPGCSVLSTPPNRLQLKSSPQSPTLQLGARALDLPRSLWWPLLISLPPYLPLSREMPAQSFITHIASLPRSNLQRLLMSLPALACGQGANDFVRLPFSTCLPCVCHAPVTTSGTHSKSVSTPGPLHGLFLLPGMPFLQMYTWPLRKLL